MFKRPGRRAAGLLSACILAVSLSSCINAASNGIFSVNTGSELDWISALKCTFRTEYPMLPLGTAGSRWPDFSKSRDIAAWAVYHDGSSRLLDSRELKTSIDGYPVESDPWVFKYEGEYPVNVKYGRFSVNYRIIVGAVDPNDGGTTITIVVQ